MKVALLMVVVGDLAGSGGAERYFADLFDFLRRQSGPPDVTLVTARAAVSKLRAAGRLGTMHGVIALPLGRQPARGWLGVLWTTALLAWVSLRQRFDVVHICLPTPTYVPFAALMSALPRALRPRVTMNVIDCTVAPNLSSPQPADLYERQVLDAHRMFSRWTRLDGVFSWYRAFVDVARTAGLFPLGAMLRAARFCFADTQRFQPAEAKENIVVFAGRLSLQKRPLLFVDTVAELCERYPTLVAEWRFVICGAGELYASVNGRIAARGLTNRITLTHEIDMSRVFNISRVFISTQAYENFTSLAMLEAMASGNAVIAANVGQTCDFVQHGTNGYLVDEETPERFADAIATYLRHPELHDNFAAASRALVVNVHTIENAADDLTAFWRDVVTQPR